MLSKSLNLKDSYESKVDNIFALKVSVFGVILVHIFPHSKWIRMRERIRECESVRMRENTNQNNSKYGNFLRSVLVVILSTNLKMFHLRIHTSVKIIRISTKKVKQITIGKSNLQTEKNPLKPESYPSVGVLSHVSIIFKTIFLNK